MEILSLNWGIFAFMLTTPLVWAVVIACALLGLAVRRWWTGFILFSCGVAAFAFILSGAFIGLGESLGSGLAAYLGFYAQTLLVPTLAYYGLAYLSLRFVWRRLRAALADRASVQEAGL